MNLRKSKVILGIISCKYILLIIIILQSSTLFAQVKVCDPYRRIICICENSSAISMDTFFKEACLVNGNSIAWSVGSAPHHGSLIASYSISGGIGGVVYTPVGLSYTPDLHYNGYGAGNADSFEIAISQTGLPTYNEKIYLEIGLNEVKPITGPSVVKIGQTVMYTDSIYPTFLGGKWSIHDNSIAYVDSGDKAGTGDTATHTMLQGRAPGIDTITFSINTGGDFCAMKKISKPVTISNSFYFSGGTSQNFVVNENSVTNNIDTLLAITDSLIGDTDVCFPYFFPAHGTLNAYYTMAATGGEYIPSGLYYTPNAGYSGIDTFSIYASINNSYATNIYTTIYVTVNPTSSSQITVVNKMEDSNYFAPVILWNGNTDQESPIINICADGSEATTIKYVNNDKSINVNNIKFRVWSNSYLADNDLHGYFDPNDISASGNMVSTKFHHPQYQPLPWNSYDTIIIYDSNTGLNIYNIPIYIIPTPVLMVHGVWADRSSFSDMENYLAYSGYDPNLLYRADYYVTNSYAFKQNAAVVPHSINYLIGNVRKMGYSFGKVDIVAHSMGGILSRLYIQSGYYRNDVHKLITINTPNYGAQSANLLENSDFTEVRWAFDHILHKNTRNGAVDDLRVDSKEITQHLNLSTNTIVPSHSIVTQSRFSFFGDWAALLIRMAELELLYSFYPGTSISYVLDPDSFDNHVFGEDNDLVVPVSSQTGGLNTSSLIFKQWHCGSPANRAVMQRVYQLLSKNPNDNTLFSNTRAPFTTHLSSAYRMSPQNRKSLRTTSSTIKITNPTNNSTFNSGSVVPISILANGGINRVLYVAVNEASPVNFCDSLSTNVTFYDTVPKNAIGVRKIVAMGFDTSGYIAMDTISIDINVNATLDSITLYGKAIFVEENATSSISTTAYYNNGYSYDISYLPNVQYQIQDENKAGYAGSNLIQGKDTGMTTLTVTYLGQTKTIPVVIIPSNDTSIIDSQSVAFGDINVYPNPSDGNVFISFISRSNNTDKCQVVNMAGQKVFEEKLDVQTGQNIFVMPLSNLPAGLYLIKITGAESYKVKRVVKYK